MSDDVESATRPLDGDTDTTDDGDFLSSMRTISDGAALYVLNAGLRNATGFVLNVLLTNTLGAVLYGIFTYGRQILTSILLFANVGTDVSTTRYLAGNRDDQRRQNGVLGFATVTTVLTSVVLSVVLFLAAPAITSRTLEEPELTTVIRLFAIAMPFQAMVRVVSSSFRGIESPLDRAVVSGTSHLLRLALVGGAVVLGYTLVGATAAYAISTATALLVAVVMLASRTELRPARPVDREHVRELLNYSLPLTVSRGGNLLYNRVDLFMVGIFLGASDVGIYTVAILVATMIALPLTGINQFFPSVTSRLYSDEEHALLQTVYQVVTRWAISLSLLVALPAVVYREELLGVFGPDFVKGQTVLLLFVVGQFINSLSGPSNDLLTMTDNQYVVLCNNWGFGLLNVGLNYLFITEYGLLGAAMATASILAALNLTRVLEVWYFEGYIAYSRRIWKPVFAAACAAVALVGARGYLTGYTLLLVGSASGVLVFFGVLWLFGLEEEDRKLIALYRGEA